MYQPAFKWNTTLGGDFMNKLDLLLSQDPQAKSFFLTLNEQEQGLLIQASNSVSSLSDMKQVLHNKNRAK